MESFKYYIGKLLPDSIFLKYRYKKLMGKPLNLRNPKTLNEKIQWLKIHDHNPLYIKLVDKVLVKKYVSSIIGEKYIIPTIGNWKHYKEINFDLLPKQFVLKCTHDSGGFVVCQNKDEFDIKTNGAKFDKWLRRNYYWPTREWPYKKIQPQIIAEKYIDDHGRPPEDYKFMCFNGKPDNVMICKDRDIGKTKFYFFDMDWNLIKCNGWGVAAPQDFTINKPPNFEQMIRIATILSKDLPLARVDLYNIDGKIYFGEITLYPDSGFDSNFLAEADVDFGDKLDLEGVKK